MYSPSTTPTKKQKSAAGFLVRPRLGLYKSFFPLTSQEKKKKGKKSGGLKMDQFRKKPDYADTAYREAVSRLRILLAESYTPVKRFRELDSAGEETDNQSLASVTSRTSRYLGRSHYNNYLSVLPRRYYYPPLKHTYLPTEGDKNIPVGPKIESSVPPELMSFIEKQEDYIEQLEKESRFCRDELGALLGKVKDVISENENLHEKQKSSIMRSVFDHLETETETETDLDLTRKLFHPSNKKSTKKTRILEGPAIVFESRISELEAQLTQAKIDLKKAQEDVDICKRNHSGVDNYTYDNCKKQIESVQREKGVLQDTVAKLQNPLSKIRDKENDTSDQVKRSLDVAEQAQYEKSAAEIEIRRLKDELDRQHTKLREAISDQGRRVADERSTVERRYTQQIEQLTSELGVQWESTNKLQLELDKQRRENTDLRRELTQKQALLDEMRKDMQTKIMTLQSDIGVTGAEKGALEQQIATLQMGNERNERQSKQEITRLQAEMQSLRQRLDRADADLIHSRRENIRLTEQVASLEKEIKLNHALNDEKRITKESSGEILALPPPKKEQELGSMINDMESKHAATVAELEGMIRSQNQLMDKLSLECHTLTTKLEDASSRHKEEIRELQTSLDRLNNRFSQSQINTSGITKDEDNPVSYQRSSPSRPQAVDPSSPQIVNKPSPTQSRRLSRTDSKSSLSRKNSHQDPPSLPQSSHHQQYQPPYQQQQLYQPESALAEDGNNDYQNYADPNQQQYAEMGDQQYMSQEQYDQQYDPNLQYDPNQQYSQDYSADPNQQYAYDPNLDYNVDPNQQQYTSDQAYDADLSATDEGQYVADPSNGQQLPIETTDDSKKEDGESTDNAKPK